MATHDEQDVRLRTPRTRPIAPRTRPVLEIVPIENTLASVAVPFPTSIAEGATAGSRAGGLGAMLGAVIGAGSYLYNNRDLASIIGAKMYTDGIRAYNKLSSYFYPDEAAPATGSNSTTPTNSVPAQPAPPPSTTPSGSASGSASLLLERNDLTNRRRSFREWLGDWIAGRNRGLTSTGGNTPPNNDQNGSFLGRMLWETKNNNFGLNWWQWRNVGRVGLYSSYPAREYVWPAVGEGLKYMAVGPDSVPTPATPPAAPAKPVATPTDTVRGQTRPDSTSYNSFDAELEELRKAYGGN